MRAAWRGPGPRRTVLVLGIVIGFLAIPREALGQG